MALPHDRGLGAALNPPKDGDPTPKMLQSAPHAIYAMSSSR